MDKIGRNSSSGSTQGLSDLESEKGTPRGQNQTTPEDLEADEFDPRYNSQIGVRQKAAERLLNDLEDALSSRNFLSKTGEIGNIHVPIKDGKSAAQLVFDKRLEERNFGITADTKKNLRELAAMAYGDDGVRRLENAQDMPK